MKIAQNWQVNFKKIAVKENFSIVIIDGNI